MGRPKMNSYEKAHARVKDAIFELWEADAPMELLEKGKQFARDIVSTQGDLFDAATKENESKKEQESVPKRRARSA